MIGVALPYEQETVIGELVDGERRIYREVFDQQSWAPLPRKVPFLRGHQRQQSPLGWTSVDNRAGGLHVLIDPVAGSTAAGDATAEVRSGVITGLSVGFWPDVNADEVDARDRRRLPIVRRRGATLREISLALEGAYPGAKITSADADATAHAESEQLLAPLRRAREVTAAERRQRDRELFEWLDRETAGPPESVTSLRESTPAPAGPLARVGGATFGVVDGQDPAYAADQYLSRVVERIARAGRALHGDELAELQRECGLLPVAAR